MTPTPAPTENPPPRPLEQELAHVYRQLGPAGPLALASVILPVIGSLTLYSLMASIGPWFREQGTFGVEIYAIGFILLAGFAILPTHPSLVLAGWAFGLQAGLLLAAGCIAASSMLAYVVTRLVARQRASALVDANPKWAIVHRALLRSGALRALWIVLLVRAPSSPFSLTNFVLAAMRVPWPIYLAGTILGMAPRAALLVYLGSVMGPLNLREAGGWWALILWIIIGAIGLAIITAIARAAIRRATGAPPSPS